MSLSDHPFAGQHLAFSCNIIPVGLFVHKNLLLDPEARGQIEQAGKE